MNEVLQPCCRRRWQQGLNSNKNNLFMLIILFGIIARIIWILIMPTYPETDFMWYFVKAKELAEGKGLLNSIYPYYIGRVGFPSAYRPIGYPGTLAIIFSVFGSRIIVGKIFNLFLSILVMFFTYKLAKINFGEKIALLTLIFVAFLPLSIVYTSILGSEYLFSAVLIISIYLFFTKNNPYILGLLIGYLILIRPIGLFIPVVFIAYYMISKSSETLKQKIRYAAVFLIMIAVTVSPWLIRNYLIFGKPVFATSGGLVLYINNNTYATGTWKDPFKYPNSPILKYRTDNGFDEMAINETSKKLAIDWIKANPVKFLKFGCRRIYYSYWSKLDDIMWSMTTGINTWHPKVNYAIYLQKVVYRIFYIILFVYLAWVIINFIRTKKIDIHIFILIIFIYFTGMMFALEGNPRYVFPIHPLYSIGCAKILFSSLPIRAAAPVPDAARQHRVASPMSLTRS